MSKTDLKTQNIISNIHFINIRGQKIFFKYIKVDNKYKSTSIAGLRDVVDAAAALNKEMTKYNLELSTVGNSEAFVKAEI